MVEEKQKKMSTKGEWVGMGRDEREEGEPAGQQSVGSEEGKKKQSGGEKREGEDREGRRGYLTLLA